MFAFHVTLHARPPGVRPGLAVSLPGGTVLTLDVPREELSLSFPVSFEAAALRLSKLPRMFLEPDGAFVWRAEQGEPAWQFDGVLWDRDGKLQFVDLKGSCQRGEFERFLAPLGWPETAVMLQDVRAAVFLDEETFRRLNGWT